MNYALSAVVATPVELLKGVYFHSKSGFCIYPTFSLSQTTTTIAEICD
jgi:hypothetical protein